MDISDGEKKKNHNLKKLNNILFTTVFLILISAIDCYSQVSIQYENPAIYAREKSGDMPTYQREFKDKGSLVIDVSNSKVSMISDTREKRTFTLHSVNHERTSGHYLAFGEGTMFTYIPNERIFFLMYQQNHIYVFELSESQNDTILAEMNNL